MATAVGEAPVQTQRKRKRNTCEVHTKSKGYNTGQSSYLTQVTDLTDDVQYPGRAPPMHLLHDQLKVVDTLLASYGGPAQSSAPVSAHTASNTITSPLDTGEVFNDFGFSARKWHAKLTQCAPEPAVVIMPAAQPPPRDPHVHHMPFWSGTPKEQARLQHEQALRFQQLSAIYGQPIHSNPGPAQSTPFNHWTIHTPTPLFPSSQAGHTTANNDSTKAKATSLVEGMMEGLARKADRGKLKRAAVEVAKGPDNVRKIAPSASEERAFGTAISANVQLLQRSQESGAKMPDEHTKLPTISKAPIKQEPSLSLPQASIELADQPKAQCLTPAPTPVAPTQVFQLQNIATICGCDNSSLEIQQKEVLCANPECRIKRYHTICVGLANRTAAPTWRCRECRPSAPLSASASSQSSNLPVVPHNPSAPTEPPLSAQQEAVVNLILRGDRNVCYTGSAGTGKSTVLKAVVKELKRRRKTVDIIAPSGIAALAVGGQTVYSYAGWVPDTFKMSLQKLGERAKGKRIRRRLCKTDVLIIEEISMVDSDVFQRLDRSCREARATPMWDWNREDDAEPGHGVYDRNLPFGGIQVIVTGDFCQLPPVKAFKFCLYCGGDELPGWQGNQGKALKCPHCRRTYEDDDKWAFRNDAWNECNFECVELTEIHRQSDPVFTSILQKCRQCVPLTAKDKQTLLHHPCNSQDAVYLRPTLAETLRINEANFKMLPGPTQVYDCWDMFDWRKDEHPELESRRVRRTDGGHEGQPTAPLKALQDHRFEERVQLKLNTLVILLVNMDLTLGLVNGAQGKVVGFEKYNKYGSEAQPKTSLPEILGEYKEVRSAQMYAFTEQRHVTAFPIVQFNNGISQTIYPVCQLSELGAENPYSLMGRTQIPLIPAWAITVHKSQGMTLTRVEVGLAKAFEREMVYVALSRCKSLEGLKVHNLPRELLTGPNFVVQEFLRGFRSADGLIPAKRRALGGNAALSGMDGDAG